MTSGGGERACRVTRYEGWKYFCRMIRQAINKSMGGIVKGCSLFKKSSVVFPFKRFS